jgi:hypothetical protein
VIIADAVCDPSRFAPINLRLCKPMKSLEVHPWSPSLADNPRTFPEFLIHRLGQLGEGVIYLQRDKSNATEFWHYSARDRDEKQQIAEVPARHFRAQIASMAVFTGTTDIKLGHSLFSVSSHPEWRTNGAGCFCAFICNEPAMGLWAKLYLYDTVSM